MRNGFRTQRRREIANRDLVEQALVTEDQVLEVETVQWILTGKEDEEMEVAGRLVVGVLYRKETSKLTSFKFDRTVIVVASFGNTFWMMECLPNFCYEFCAGAGLNGDRSTIRWERVWEVDGEVNEDQQDQTGHG